MKKVFDITDRDYRIRAYWGKCSDARVTIYNKNKLYEEFKYPAYKIFNLAAHFSDIVDGIINEEKQKGFLIAGSDGIGGFIMPKRNEENN